MREGPPSIKQQAPLPEVARVCQHRNIVVEANALTNSRRDLVKSSRFSWVDQSRRNFSNLHFYSDGVFLAKVDCCRIVRELPNESHKIGIDVDFRVVRVRESHKSHMILPVAMAEDDSTVFVLREHTALGQCPYVQSNLSGQSTKAGT